MEQSRYSAFFVALFIFASSVDVLATSRMDMYDIGSGRLVFLGAVREKVTAKEYLRTTHVCRPDGKLIIESETRLVAPDLTSGHSRQSDHRRGAVALLELDENEIGLSYREKEAAESKTSRESRPGQCIAPDALSLYVRDNWARLAKGDVLYPRLAVADAGRVVMFRLHKEKLDENVLVLRLEPSSWVYRRFVDPSFLHFELVDPHRLAEVTGPTNYTDESGKRLSLRIVYTVLPEGAPPPCGEATP